jgi:hypothetical protein
VRILRPAAQQDSLAQYYWDLCELAVAALSVAPLARPETVDLRTLSLGFSIAVLFAIFGYILDGMEVQS